MRPSRPGDGPPLEINLSTVSAFDPGFSAMITTQLARRRASPGSLIVELDDFEPPESADYPPRAAGLQDRPPLRPEEFECSGFSMLARLGTLPFD